jgi:hypothetical protein
MVARLPRRYADSIPATRRQPCVVVTNTRVRSHRATTLAIPVLARVWNASSTTHSGLFRGTPVKALTLGEFLRRHGNALDSEDLLGSVHNYGNSGARLVSSKSICLGNELLDFGDFLYCGCFGILDICNTLVVVVRDPSQPLTQTIDRIRAFSKCLGFDLVFFGQIKVLGFALPKARDKIVDGVSLIL